MQRPYKRAYIHTEKSQLYDIVIYAATIYVT